ncbi:MAG TPA: glycerol-3-phosphate acyltransferase [Candidatus Pacearchaeota archaeon]|nr:glycerol-3-phosphate acyltransferase [Candidatus Pacearchaeota archaeon]
MKYFIVILVSYLLGSIPFGLIINKLFFKEKDLRQAGSKNIGALNTLRVAGKEKGKITGIIAFFLVFLLDGGKAVLSVYLAQSLINTSLATALAAFFVVLGHNHSLFLKFKGGRGAASLMGILFYFDWKAFFGWIILIFCFMVLFEILAGRKLNKKFLKHAVSDQVAGRLAGEVFALFWLYTYNILIFYPALAATPLILLAHRDRLAEQIKNIKNKTYLND